MPVDNPTYQPAKPKTKTMNSLDTTGAHPTNRIGTNCFYFFPCQKM